MWETLKDVMLCVGTRLEEPDARIGEKDNFMYTWRKDNYYLECEIFADIGSCCLLTSII